MADETQGAPAAAPKKKLSTKMIIIIVASVLVFGTGAGLSIKFFSGKGKQANVEGEGSEKGASEEKRSESKGEGEGKGEGKGKNAQVLALEPFVVNLSAPGRYLKATMHFELKSANDADAIQTRMAMIRDVIITVLSSKSTDAVSGPEGKFQLKDELLFRVNQAMGKEVVKNIYFTEFVMQ